MGRGRGGKVGLGGRVVIGFAGRGILLFVLGS